MTRRREHEQMPPTPPTREPDEREMIPLQDLAPRQDVKGGASKLLFGQDVESLFDGTN